MRQIQDVTRQIYTRQSTIQRVEREMKDKERYYNQQIQREKEEIKRLEKQIEDFKRKL